MGFTEEKHYLDRIDQRDTERATASKRVKDKWHRKISNSKKKIESIGCEHHFYHTIVEDRDDGYGKCWKVAVHTCKVCGSFRERDSGQWMQN